MTSALLGVIALSGCETLDPSSLGSVPSLPALPALSPAGTAWKDFEAGDFQASQEAFTRQVEAHPEDPAGHYGLGRVALAQGQREAAIAHFERAIALDGDSAAAWAYLGTAQLQLERNEDAHASLQKSLSLDSEQGQALVAMAEYAATIEVDHEKALRHLEQAKSAGYTAIPPDLESALRRRLN